MTANKQAQKPRNVPRIVLVAILAALLFTVVGYMAAQKLSSSPHTDGGACTVQTGGGLHGEDVEICP